MALVAASSLEDFRASPIGRWFAGKTFLLWAASPSLAGSVYFSRPTEDEWTALLGIANVASHPSLRRPFDVVVDASGLDGLSMAAFEALLAHIDFMKSFGPLIRKVGCVRPRGLIGAAMAGVFYEAVEKSFHAALFAERAEAFAWLGQEGAPEFANELNALIDSVRSTPAVLRSLRAHLLAKRGLTDLPRAARALGTAPRSLQRALGELGTTFTTEVERARLAAAERMLLDEDLKIAVVARRAGFTSASHLARSFRKYTGETPADFRRRRVSTF